MTVLAGLGAGKKPRGIAEDIWGEKEVAAVWYRPMRGIGEPQRQISA